MRVIACGGRDYHDFVRIHAALQAIHEETPISMLIEGGYRHTDAEGHIVPGGADYYAHEWSMNAEVPCMTVWAKWRTGDAGRGEGPKRNALMLRFKPKLVVAFPGNTGTADMVRQAKGAGVNVRVVE